MSSEVAMFLHCVCVLDRHHSCSAVIFVLTRWRLGVIIDSMDYERIRDHVFLTQADSRVELLIMHFSRVTVGYPTCIPCCPGRQSYIFRALRSPAPALVVP